MRDGYGALFLKSLTSPQELKNLAWSEEPQLAAYLGVGFSFRPASLGAPILVRSLGNFVSPCGWLLFLKGNPKENHPTWGPLQKEQAHYSLDYK